MAPSYVRDFFVHYLGNHLPFPVQQLARFSRTTGVRRTLLVHCPGFLAQEGGRGIAGL